MPSQEARAASGDATQKKLERLLRLLSWQLSLIIILLVYLALRPPAGRYQLIPPFTIADGTVVMFDTVAGKGELTTILTQEHGASGQGAADGRSGSVPEVR